MKILHSTPYVISICVGLLMISMSCSKDEVITEETLIEEVFNDKEVVGNQSNEDEGEVVEISEALSVAEEILQILNAHRISIGKNALEINGLATDLANEHTVYMIAQNDISHDDFDERSDRLIAEENASRTGENVAYGQRSAQQVMTAWLNSPGHRKNIEGDFTHIGIGVIKNDAGVYYFTQLFLKKRSVNT